MIEKIIEFSIRNRFVVILSACVVIAWGVYCVIHTPVDAIPDLSENQVIVFTDWMGRSPREIEDQVTYPLSVNLQGLAGVKAVRASSEFNFSMIDVIFEDNVDFYFARERVLERLALAGTFLPPGVTPYLAPDATALGQIFWYTVEGEGYDLGRLRAIQDWYVRYQLNSVPGVAQVASVGGFPIEYQIDVAPNKLRAYGVTLGDLYAAVARSNSSVGGGVIQKGNAEYLVRGVGWIRSLRDIENIVVKVDRKSGTPVCVSNLAAVGRGSEFRRSVLEKNGNEAVGAVVMMRYGENPLAVTQRIKEKIVQLQAGLPEGVRIVPFYDRTRLIAGAIHTLTTMLTHEMIIASLAILLILMHFRSAFVICLTLPMAVLISFILMRYFGIASNIMSLSGIAVSIGILVDQAIVMVENATHHLTAHFGDQRVSGDTRELVIPACRTVGRPIFFSVMIILLSFIPVFALSGQEGKTFHPLAFTKSFAMIGVAILSITLVPALIPTFIRGRLRREEESWLVRSLISIYKPVLSWAMNYPKTVNWFFIVLLALGWHLWGKLGREYMPALDEGSILDMPVTVLRASITEVADDLKARNAVLRQFPEVEMIVGKGGRADTPTDPSPLEMVETIIDLRPKELWPKRKMDYADAQRQTGVVLDALEKRGLMHAVEIRPSPSGRGAKGDGSDEAGRPKDTTPAPTALSLTLSQRERGRAERNAMIDRVTMAAMGRLDATLRELIMQRYRELESEVSPSMSEDDRNAHWRKRARQIDYEVFDQAVSAYNWYCIEELRAANPKSELSSSPSALRPPPFSPALQALREQLDPPFARRLLLWQKTKSDIVQEMDSVMQMPGWANIWTQPIINRIDMLATGVRTMIGVKVFGNDLNEIQTVSAEVAAVLKDISGAVDVFPDQSIGKGYLEITIDREKAARYGVNVGDVQDVIEVALGGKPITMTVEGRQRFPVRIRYARAWREDEEQVKNLLVNAGGGMAAAGMAETGPNGMGSLAGRPPASPSPLQVPLSAVADVRIVEGPAMIRSENGMLRSYVQLNVRGRDIVGFVEEARRLVEEKVKLPQGMYIEWSGQFEHQVRARKTLQLVFPAVGLLIFIILYLTYNDLMDAVLMMMAVPEALVGGIFFLWLFGYNFSVAVWVGFIACFGMATETGIIMLVYLREAIEKRGGLQKIASLDELRQAIIEGAVHRLRPKLLTEGVAIIALAPMLWASGVGHEVISAMAAPVLGGLLIADEVVDIFIPVRFYWVRRRRWLKLHGKS
jgi:Cu(I)/Ag(I) efflux system membrane protein CusA/SilA